MLTGKKMRIFFKKIWNTLQICMLSSCSSHANLLSIFPILAYMLPCLKNIAILFYVNGCFACIWSNQLSAMPMEARRGHHIPRTRVTDISNYVGAGNWTQVSARATSILNCWALSQNPQEQGDYFKAPMACPEEPQKKLRSARLSHVDSFKGLGKALPFHLSKTPG